jgi:hypothetical protein
VPRVTAFRVTIRYALSTIRYSSGIARTVLALILCLWGFFAAPGGATDYYVSSSGSDGNDGLSTTTAFRTLQYAASLPALAPGDRVRVMNGTYSAVVLTKSGTPTAWITWQAYPGHTPEIVFNGWYGIQVQASYQVIDGLTVTGNNDNVNLSYCQADAQNNPNNPDSACNGSDISIDGRGHPGTALYHHITIRNCTLRKGGAGVGAIWSDYVTIEDNLIYGNAWYSRYGSSGISTWQDLQFDAAPGYHMIIRRNVVYDNNDQVTPANDGNGIIIDNSECTQVGCPNGVFPNRTLVSNNLSVNNGGAGVVCYTSEHVDIVNNTAYQNVQVVTTPGWSDLFVNQCSDLTLLNNIAYSKAGGNANQLYGGTNITVDYNLYFNGTVAVSGAHDLTADPKFVNPSTDPTAATFRLQTGSPAIYSGTVIAAVTPTLDLSGVTRPQPGGLSRGAYEFISASGPPVTVAPIDLAFASQIVGTVSAAQTVTLTNTGNAALTISSIAISGDFSETNNCGGSVSGGANCTINVSFAPRAGGSRLGAVTIADNALGSPQTVALSGAGADFSLSANPTSNAVTAGSLATYTVNVNALGGLNQAVALKCTEPASLTQSSCSISPTSVMPNGTKAVSATLTVTTFVSHPCALNGPTLPGRRWSSRRLVFWAFLAMLLTLPLAPRRRRRWALLGATTLVLAGWVGCGGGGPPPCESTPATPAGTYTLTVTGTYTSGSATLSHTQNLTLTVN